MQLGFKCWLQVNDRFTRGPRHSTKHIDTATWLKILYNRASHLPH